MNQQLCLALAAGRRSNCPPPPQPDNTEDIGQKRDYFNGEKIQMKCKTGFKLNGPTSVLCQNDKWTSPPQCVSKYFLQTLNNTSFSLKNVGISATSCRVEHLKKKVGKLNLNLQP